MIRKHYTEIKSLNTRTKLPDIYFPAKYHISPYRGCEHGCLYCDGRAEKYYVKGDFECDIEIRKNMTEFLYKKFPSLKEKGIISFGSGVSDVYQRVEEEECIMQKSVEIVEKFGLSASVMTKSKLILRDIDLWEKVHKNSGFYLMVSLTILDDNIRKIIEPEASSVEERLQIIREFKKRNMKVGVLAMPFIPYITDEDKKINKLIETLKKLDIDFIMPGLMTLRPGRQKRFFLDKIQNEYPNYREKIEKIYEGEFVSGAPLFSYSKKKFKYIQKIIGENKISMEVPHSIYKDMFPVYDEIWILLSHMHNIYTEKHIDLQRLITSKENYRKWLLSEKVIFNRKRNVSYIELEDKLKKLFLSGKMKGILDNKKLYGFLYEIVIQRRTFDYLKLKLI